MANVFGGGGGNCGTGGVQRVLPTSPDATQSNASQTFSTQPNVYAKPKAGADGINLRDFYTKSDINKFLKTKADIGSVYDKSEVDSLLAALQASVNSSILPLVTEAELASALSSLSQTLLADVQSNYYTKDVLYTKYELDILFADVTTDPDDFVSKSPTLLLQNTIDPGSSQAIPLTLVASESTQVDVVQQWIDHEANSIGRIRKSGQVEFYGNLILGENIESWRPALDASERRIAGVADPIHTLDAVNKGFMEDYVTEVIDNVVQGDDKNYIIDALVY
jgi:hypothetical protein